MLRLPIFFTAMALLCGLTSPSFAASCKVAEEPSWKSSFPKMSFEEARQMTRPNETDREKAVGVVSIRQNGLMDIRTVYHQPKNFDPNKDPSPPQLPPLTIDSSYCLYERLLAEVAPIKPGEMKFFFRDWRAIQVGGSPQ